MSQLNPTMGERRVGYYFEASDNLVADHVKIQSAALIDLVSAYEENDREEAEKAQLLFQQGCEAFVRLLNKKK